MTARKAALCAFAVLLTACVAAHADSAGVHSSHRLVASAAAGPDGGGNQDGSDGDDGKGDGKDDKGDKGDGKNDKGDKGDDKNDKGDKGDDKSDDSDGGGLDVLGSDCSKSDLEAHDGFEEAPRCVDTAFGEVAEDDKSPSLMITESPDTVKAGEDFTLRVSTRNLVRDRFLGAADGGYYKESSFLNKDGIQRGHFHTACRMLDSTDEAPEPAPEPKFFLATQDNGGGIDPDTVEIPISGIEERGTLQCAVWAGDGSHRIPMMQRANQIPAFDVVRITVE